MLYGHAYRVQMVGHTHAIQSAAAYCEVHGMKL